MPSWMSWSRITDETRTRLWPLPVAALLTAVVLGIVLPRLDAAIGDDMPPALTAYLFGGGAGAARTVLNAIATSMITVTSLTFSLTVLTLQLASSQYSPRLLRTFTRDRFVQRTLALFLGSFVYALTVLRTVRTADDAGQPFVPQISVTVAFTLTLATALGLVLFLAHLARQIRVETVLVNVHDESSGSFARALGERETVDPAAIPPGPESAVRLLRAPASGFIIAMDPDVLHEAAQQTGAVVVVDRPVGDSLVEATPIGRAWSLASDTLTEDEAEALQQGLASAMGIGFERTSHQDVSFGLRQLTDVTVKALSPSINDPTTAAHTLNHAAALLCDVLRLDLGAEARRDDDGRLRVVVRQRSFPELLDLALTQPLLYGAADPFILVALLELLDAVAHVAVQRGQGGAVAAQLDRVQTVIDKGDLDDARRKDLLTRASAVHEVLRAASA